VITSPALADARGLRADSDPAALATAPLLHLDLGDRGWLAWQDWFAANGVDPPAPHRRILFHYYPLVLRQAIAGHGVALGWRALVDGLVTTRLLVVVGPEVSTPRGYHLTWSPGRVREPARAIARAVRTLAGHHASSTPVL
jgi:DNA-binding transcriptional LysR family regulator